MAAGGRGRGLRRPPPGPLRVGGHRPGRSATRWCRRWRPGRRGSAWAARKGELAVVQAILYLGTAPKSNALYAGWKAAQDAARATGSLPPPAHILNAPTRLMAGLGYGKGYSYDHDAPDAFSGQNYFPPGLPRQAFYQPADRGFEREVGRRLDHWSALRAARPADAVTCFRKRHQKHARTRHRDRLSTHYDRRADPRRDRRRGRAAPGSLVPPSLPRRDAGRHPEDVPHRPDPRGWQARRNLDPAGAGPGHPRAAPTRRPATQARRDARVQPGHRAGAAGDDPASGRSCAGAQQAARPGRPRRPPASPGTSTACWTGCAWGTSTGRAWCIAWTATPRAAWCWRARRARRPSWRRPSAGGT